MSDGEPETITILTAGGEESLLIANRMREIEGRRFAGRGRWRDREVFYKVFVAADRARKHVARERLGAGRLAEHGIPGAGLLIEGEARGEGLPKGSRAVLYEWIPEADNVDQLLRSGCGATRTLAIMRDLARLIGRHHAEGLVQKDLHLANFAIAGETIYTFDTASIEARKAPLSRGAAFDNLALFFAQIDPGWDSAIPVLLDAYVETAGQDARPDLDRLHRKIVKERERRMSRFLDKVLRSCRLTEPAKIAGATILFARPADEELLALGRRIQEGPAPADGLGLIFRGETIRLRVLPPPEGRARGPGSHLRCWRNAQRLVLEGVPTPAPLCCGERDGQGWFLADQPTGATLESLVAEAACDPAALADEVAQVLQRIDQLGLEYGGVGRRSFVRMRDGRLGLTDLEDLVDRPAAALGAETRTSPDMESALAAWQGSALAAPLLAALQRRGYALDLA